ncbi:B12-binding domain-containing radical SAM protein [Fusobacterium varium]|jgi:anaerobic magnesium-protoporphyrin IX monomethyl ester cyclase|uniref:B12-binding domain-containing radical SAM protein n=1 Tax=Fusobacterium varium TaxID=856 RepID=UPI00266B3FD4|nr:radical SAM protein [Fusobacterium varium]
MKCLLFNSPIYREHSEVKEEYLPPLGLGYIATHLDKAGVKVEIVDCVKEQLGIDEIFKLLEQQTPNFIGINIFTQNFETVKEIVERCPIKTMIIIGGQVVKCIYEDLLQWNVSNQLVIVIGEGELIFPTLINGSCSELPFTTSMEQKEVYKVDKNSCYFPKDLDIVYLNRKLLKEDIITNHYGQKEAAIITSRGCIYNCAFCGGAHKLNQDVTIRCRSTVNIENEIQEIISANPCITSIRVLDDLFLKDKESINNAVMLFKKFNNLSWRGMAHILTFVENLKLLPLLKQSGCKEVFIGIESGSERIRKKINKPGTIEQVIEVISAILKCGIDVKGYFMFGFPSETTTEADATYLLASKLKEISAKTLGNFRASVFQFRPYHGTQLYNEIVKSGRKIPMITSNTTLNILDGRSQFNFQSGNYSNIDDNTLNEYILKTQNLSEV